jgi:putative ABC transport system permease protein
VLNKISIAFFLTIRSIFRGNSWLSIMPTFMMILVFMNLVFTPALLEGVISTMNTKLINTLTGNITVENKPTGTLIPNAKELVAKIDDTTGVEAAAASRNTSAQLILGNERGTAELLGIDPRTYDAVYSAPQNMIEGSFLSPGDRDQIVLGAQVAGAGKAKLELYNDSLKNAHVGDVVTVNMPGGITKKYTVKGIFQTEFVQADLKTFVTNEDFDVVRPDTVGKASAINVRTSPGANDQVVIDRINTLQSDLQFRTWQQRAGFVQSYTASIQIINQILRLVALIVGALTIFIITYVDVVNKRRQIGIERAIGISSSAIVLSYIFRAFMYTLLGSVLGILLFIFVAVPIEKRYPFHFPLGDVYLAINYGFLLLNALILLLVSMLSAFVPSWRAVRIRIVEAIWGT